MRQGEVDQEIAVSSTIKAPIVTSSAATQIGRRFSSAVVLFHAAVAERFGLNATDWKCGDVLSRMGPLNPTRLADLVGMSTAAVTQVIDRLERAGFARRERDSHDRRKVTVHPTATPEMAQIMGDIFSGVSQTMNTLLERYSPEQLAAIEDFIEQATLALEVETTRIRQIIAPTAGRETLKHRAE
jgi:DNA-binding MarR family transcriptional regulator